MVMVRKRRFIANIALCIALTLILAACSNAALFGLVKSKGKTPAAIKHSLVVFPFDRDAELNASVPDTIGTSVAEYLRIVLATSKGYTVLLYEDRLMPIQRAKTDNAVKDTETKAPFFADRNKAGKLAEILASEYYLIGSVEGYSYDKEKKVAEVTLKADLMLVEKGKVGKVAQEIVVGGSAEAGNQAMDEEYLQSLAVGKAVEALREKLLATSAADVKPVVLPKPKK